MGVDLLEVVLVYADGVLVLLSGDCGEQGVQAVGVLLVSVQGGLLLLVVGGLNLLQLGGE